jgi:hypothetical protein
MEPVALGRIAARTTPYPAAELALAGDNGPSYDPHMLTALPRSPDGATGCVPSIAGVAAGGAPAEHHASR